METVEIEVKKGLKLYGEPSTVSPIPGEDPRAFFVRFWDSIVNGYFLAFADDGVIWGMINGGVLHLSTDADPGSSPPLRWETLHRAHLFNSTREIRVWKESGRFKGATLSDKDSQDSRYYDETHLILGDKGSSSMPIPGTGIGFARMEDLAGQWHVMPIPADTVAIERASLRLRNYLEEEDGTGMLFVRKSRIIGLDFGKEERG